MKIAVSAAALLLGLAQRAEGFACTWNGAGSSYVYHTLTYTTDGYDVNEPCVLGVGDEYAQTTCCRCSTAVECNAAPPGNYDAVDTLTLGCDLYAPDINIADAVEAASAPGMWFTDADQLETFLYSTVKCTDDCVLEPTCERQVEYFDTNLDDLCANTYVTVTSNDWVGCQNQNTAQKSFYVRFDDLAPDVTVTLGEFLAKKVAGPQKWEDIPLLVQVEDNCDPNPEVIITVYSDEITAKNPHSTPAVLERKYSNTGASGVLQGWGLTLDHTSYARKLCGPTNECYEADGRFYIVRVCAKDAAGNWDCAEDSVGVPLTPAELKHVVPENQGKLFKIAEDRGLWGAAPDELSYRPNPVTAGLNVPVTPKYVLCNSNYKLIGGTSMATTQTTVDQCAIECAATTNCQGFVFEFTANPNNCQLYTTLGTRDPNVYTGSNIYVLPGVQCPVPI